MTGAATFAVVAVTLFTAHYVADYWVQTNAQAQAKSGPGWPGRIACAAHVTTYTLTLAVFLGVVAWRFSLPLNPAAAVTGLAVNGLLHYVGDRRGPLRRLARLLGKGAYWDAGGAKDLDQAYHLGLFFITTLIITG
jgi:hypothetical protein